MDSPLGGPRFFGLRDKPLKKHMGSKLVISRQMLLQLPAS